jgi:hypothetical protein
MAGRGEIGLKGEGVSYMGEFLKSGVDWEK